MQSLSAGRGVSNRGMGLVGALPAVSSANFEGMAMVANPSLPGGVLISKDWGWLQSLSAGKGVISRGLGLIAAVSPGRGMNTEARRSLMQFSGTMDDCKDILLDRLAATKRGT